MCLVVVKNIPHDDVVRRACVEINGVTHIGALAEVVMEDVVLDDHVLAVVKVVIHQAAIPKRPATVVNLIVLENAALHVQTNHVSGTVTDGIVADDVTGSHRLEHSRSG